MSYSSRGTRGCCPSGESAKGNEWRDFSLETTVDCSGSTKNGGEQRTPTVSGGQAVTKGVDELPSIRFEWRRHRGMACRVVAAEAATLYSGEGE
jgi:hypothetical protein